MSTQPTGSQGSDAETMRVALEEAKSRLEAAITSMQGNPAVISTRPSPALWDNNSSCNSSCSCKKLASNPAETQ